MIYKIAQHRGGLKEMLETEKEITEKEARFLLNTKYKYYCYDERIKAHRYIKKDLESLTDLWLNVYNK